MSDSNDVVHWTRRIVPPRRFYSPPPPAMETMTITSRTFRLSDVPPDVAEDVLRLLPTIGAQIQARMEATIYGALLGDPGYGHPVIDGEIIPQVPDSHRLPEAAHDPE